MADIRSRKGIKTLLTSTALVKQKGNMENISEAVQKEVARIRGTLAETKMLFPNRSVNFIIYEMVLAQADKAVREQDAAILVKLLPQLKEMQ